MAGPRRAGLFALGWWVVVTAAGALASGAFAVALISALDRSPREAMSALWEGSFGTWLAIGNTVNVTAVIMCCGLSFLVAYRSGLFSIGQQGQLLVGAVAGTAVAVSVADGLPGLVGIPMALVGGALGGGLLAGLAGWLAARHDVNITISTLLLNFVAASVASLSVQYESLLRQPAAASSEPQSVAIPHALRLPRLGLPDSSPAHLGIVIALVLGAAVWFLLTRTVFGLRIRLLRANPAIAERSGADRGRLIVTTMFCSGALAGVAGTILVLGDIYRLRGDMTGDVGFVGIAAGLIGVGVAGLVVAATAFGALTAGGGLMEIRSGVSAFNVLVIQGVFIVILAVTIRLDPPAWWRQRMYGRTGPAVDEPRPGP